MATPAHLDDPSRARKWQAAIATTVAAWLVAFGVVTALLTVFGDELATLPLALRALLISGVLVALMVNLVMPVLSVAVARWARGAPQGADGRERPPRHEYGARAQLIVGGHICSSPFVLLVNDHERPWS